MKTKTKQTAMKLFYSFSMILGGLIFFRCLLPYYIHFTTIPNRHLLPWDMALHAKDGLMFYLQATRGDLISILWGIINTTFWMPLHPLLVAVTSLFRPFHYDHLVLLNFIALSICVAWSFKILIDSKIYLTQKMTVGSIVWFGLLRMLNDPASWGTQLNIMIEPLGLGLTIVFTLSFLLEIADSNNLKLMRSANFSLFLLFFTKIQYGLFYFIPFFIWRCRLLFSRVSLRNDSILILKHFIRTYSISIPLVLLALIGASSTLLILLKLSSPMSLADALWAILFSVLLFFTWLRFSRHSISNNYWKKLPFELKQTINWIILGFGWYYLFPIKQKVRWLLFNTSYVSKESFTQKLLAMWTDFGMFFQTSYLTTSLCVVTLVTLSYVLYKRRVFTSAVYAVWAMISIFYFALTFANGARLVRFSSTWVILFPIAIGVFGAWVLRPQLQKVVVVLALILCAKEAFRVQKLAPQAAKHMGELAFLSPDHQSIQKALSDFNFNRPGVVYGLGKTMDLATILFDLEILRAKPEYSSVFSKRADREVLANDFGREGNSAPLQFILSHSDKFSSFQVMLFKSGFETMELVKFAALLRDEKGFVLKNETPHYIFLVRDM